MKKIVWLAVSCSIVASLLLASCGPSVTEEEEVVVVEEEVVIPEEEQEVVTEEEAAPPAAEQEVVTEEEATPTPSPAVTPESIIPIIDAHSQFDEYIELERVIELIDQAGVSVTILSSRASNMEQMEELLVSFASVYPGKIIPAVRSKGFMESLGDEYPQFLELQVAEHQYGAMAEVLMYHAALERPNFSCDVIVIHPDDDNVYAAVNCAIDNKWPFIAHIEFVAAGDLRNEFMTKFKALLVQYPEHPFVLIHMGQLDHAAVRQLIEAHDNIYFITSSSTPAYTKVADSPPWTNMFDGRNLSADWKQLMIDHPDRFILGFDMVFAEQWGQFYLGQVTLWREAIKELPVEVAHAFAHGNAERLWHLTETPPLAPPEEEEEEEVAPPTPPADTTPPSAITGLVANDAYDGRVNLSWDKSTAEDFDQYNIYLSKTEIADAAGMTPTQQIRDIATCNYQATGLEEGARYYFAVTAVDKNGNENRRVTSLSATPTPMPRGTVDPDISVDIYQSDKAWAGTTLLPDNHNPESPRVIEVNMLGEIVWEYRLPQNLKQYTNPGFDVESLTNNNILLVLPRSGVYEIDRNGKIVWSYLDEKVSHDADRLPNGNTIFVFGNDDQKSDAQVTEVNPEGEIVWTWYARDHFDKSPYKDIYDEGWTHTNAVTRMSNGNTLISLRNFSSVVEVDPQGSVIRTIGEGILGSVHDPAILPNGNLLATCTAAGETRQGQPCVRAVEIDPKTGEVVWQFAGFEPESFPVRDANRLPNGNTLITGSTKIVEVTPEDKIVWQLTLKGVTFEREEASALGFYKAERIAIQ